MWTTVKICDVISKISKLGVMVRYGLHFGKVREAEKV